MEEGRVTTFLDDSHSQKRRSLGDLASRTETCVEFATKRRRYGSVDSFISQKRDEMGESPGWLPSKGQMVRDMRRIFGAGWAKKRGRGKKARGETGEESVIAPGLTVPPNAATLLQPSHRPTMLCPEMERSILKEISFFENRFGTNLITPTLIESLANMQILSNLPNTNLGNCDLAKVLKQLRSVQKPGWMRSFLHRHKDALKPTIRRRALERHKAAKLQVELVMSHFRNVYQEEALAQLQSSMARSGKILN